MFFIFSDPTLLQGGANLSLLWKFEAFTIQLVHLKVIQVIIPIANLILIFLFFLKKAMKYQSGVCF